MAVWMLTILVWKVYREYCLIHCTRYYLQCLVHWIWTLRKSKLKKVMTVLDIFHTVGFDQFHEKIYNKIEIWELWVKPQITKHWCCPRRPALALSPLEDIFMSLAFESPVLCLDVGIIIIIIIIIIRQLVRRRNMSEVTTRAPYIGIGLLEKCFGIDKVDRYNIYYAISILVCDIVVEIWLCTKVLARSWRN